jgi:hypothetical protein
VRRDLSGLSPYAAVRGRPPGLISYESSDDTPLRPGRNHVNLQRCLSQTLQPPEVLAPEATPRSFYLDKAGICGRLVVRVLSIVTAAVRVDDACKRPRDDFDRLGPPIGKDMLIGLPQLPPGWEQSDLS